MATTPNLPVEQANKQTLRAQTRGGVTPSNPNVPIDEALMVNAFAQASGVLRLSGVTASNTFTISGTGGNSATITGSSAKVSDLVTALGAGPLASTAFFVNAGPAQLLKGNTGASGTVVDIIVPSGIVLSVISGTGTTPTLTAVTFTGTNAAAVTYPNYYGTPNATPNWVDDVTGHSYDVGYAGLYQGTVTTLSGGTAVVQKQVRQISTQVSETQEYDGYYVTYSGNLFQTTQKNTRRQQS